MSSKQPNIIFIMADDLGYNDVGIQGSTIYTPNIDRLAKQGVILENHYVMPICSPTRASFMTGRYAIRTGFWWGNLNPTEKWGLPLDEQIIPEMLSKYGYVSHAVGKWHLGMYSVNHTPVYRGFKTFLGMYLGSGDYFQHTNSKSFDFRYNYRNVHGDMRDVILKPYKGIYSTEVYTNWTMTILDKQKKSDKPMFLYLAYTSPHGPYQVPEGYKSSLPRQPKPASITRKTYCAMISNMDHGIGRIIDRLTELDMMDNTIIIFSSDNGAVMTQNGGPGSNYPLRGGKKGFHEGGVRAFTFVHSPLFDKTGYLNTHLHHVTDWYPTFEYLAKGERRRRKKKHVEDNATEGGPPDSGVRDNTIDGVNIWPSLSANKSCRNSVLINLRKADKYTPRSNNKPGNAGKEVQLDVGFNQVEEENDVENVIENEIELEAQQSLRNIQLDKRLYSREVGTEVMDEDESVEIMDEAATELMDENEEGTELIDEDGIEVVDENDNENIGENGTELVDEDDDSTTDDLHEPTGHNSDETSGETSEFATEVIDEDVEESSGRNRTESNDTTRNDTESNTGSEPRNEDGTEIIDEDSDNNATKDMRSSDTETGTELIDEVDAESASEDKNRTRGESKTDKPADGSEGESGTEVLDEDSPDVVYTDVTSNETESEAGAETRERDKKDPKLKNKSNKNGRKKKKGKIKKGKEKTKASNNPVTDLVVYRWRSWKLIVGNERQLYEGWKLSNQGGIAKDIKDIDTSALADEERMFLYELSTDPREKRNLATKYPQVLTILLTKVRKYYDRIVPITQRKISDKGKRKNIWSPWVRYL